MKQSRRVKPGCGDRSGDTLDKKSRGARKDRQKVEIYGQIGGNFSIHTGDLGGRDPRGVP